MPEARNPTPLTKPRRGMLAGVNVAEAGGLRWGRGLTWVPEMGGDPSTSSGVQALDCVTTAIDHSEFATPDAATAYPFMVYAFDKCSAIDFERQRESLVRRKIEATQSFNIAKEFWTGTLTASVNAELRGATAMSPASGTPTEAVGYLDDIIADRLANGQGMIHTSLNTLVKLVNAQVVRREGTSWLTPNDNPVITDGGYAGTNAGNANTDWLVATSPVTVHLGPIDATAFPTVASLDPSDIDVVVFAKRDAIVLHDYTVLYHAIELS